jgi:hypothetical protein
VSTRDWNAADPATVNATIRALRRNGWASADIAKTMRLDLAVVLEALRTAS